MNIVLDISTTSFLHYANIYFLISFTKFLKNIWVTMKGLFSCLVRVALLSPCAIILENKSEALGIKSLVLREHLVIRRSSENIGPEENVDGILLDKWGIRTINNGNLSLLSKSL